MPAGLARVLRMLMAMLQVEAAQLLSLAVAAAAVAVRLPSLAVVVAVVVAVVEIYLHRQGSFQPHPQAICHLCSLQPLNQAHLRGTPICRRKTNRQKERQEQGSWGSRN
jgi:hypothetical protein